MQHNRHVTRIDAEHRAPHGRAPAGAPPGWSRRRGPVAFLRAALGARRRIAGRLLVFLLVIPLVIGVAAPPRSAATTSRTPGPAEGAAAEDRRPEGRSSEASGPAAGLASDIASTNHALGGINADLARRSRRSPA